ncbi:hypothetical protein ACNHYB_10730 [Isoptericola jiangsuensis]
MQLEEASGARGGVVAAVDVGTHERTPPLVAQGRVDRDEPGA